MKTFHSIAHFAQNEAAGHFYHYHKAVQQALMPHVKEASVYIPRNSNFTETLPGWKKWFSPFFNRTNRKQFWRECCRLFKQPSMEERIFFIEFFGRRDFFLYALAALFYGRKTDVLWTLYRDDLEIRRKKDLKVIRLFSKCLQWKFKNRFIPLTDSEPLADYYATWFTQRPHVLPILTTRFEPVRVHLKDKLKCAWLGSPRPEKGAPEIAALVQIDDPQASRVELEVSGAAYLPMIKNQITLKLRKAFLSESEYYDALYSSDILLLPYDPKKYKRRTSGVFVEALLAGKIPLVKEGSWLAYELARFDLKELIVAWDNPLFFSHLCALVHDSTMLNKLKEMQKAYLSFHGSDNFSNSLYKLLKNY